MKSLFRICLVVLFVAGFSTGVLAAGTEKGALWAASDGNGSVALFWISGGALPQGGWKLERVSAGKATVIANHLAPGVDENAMKKLDPKEAAGLRDFSGKLRAGRLTKGETDNAVFVFGLRSAVDPAFGAAMGLRYTDGGLGKGEVTYRVSGLDGQGRPVFSLQSQKVDPAVATPPPAPISSFKGETIDDGVLLSWVKPSPDSNHPAVAYHIERIDPGAKTTVLTSKPLLIAADTSKKKAVKPEGYLDRKPPVETSITYVVYSLDVFQRRSNPVNLSIFVPDREALVPPALVNAKPGGNRVDLKWKAKDNPNTAGYVVERSFTAGGDYETITKDRLSRGTDSYTDADLAAGKNYYYRLRSVNRRGDIGHPSQVVMGRPDSKDAPDRPDALKAEVGTNRVRLTWTPSTVPVAGYVIERKLDGSDRWMRMNQTLYTEPVYDDRFGPGNGGKQRYRVTSVGRDNKRSSLSGEVEANLPDNLPPAMPQITDISGKGGKVVMRFRPASPEDESYQFLVLRSSSPREQGLVIGDALPAAARTFEDTFVESGSEYWYSLVALDKVGNRSDPTRPVVARAGIPPIPKPKKPETRLVAKPFEHILINFERAPNGLDAMVQTTEDPSKGWKIISGPGGDFSQAVDQQPPQKGKAYYRIVYQTTSGVMGDPSDSAEFSR